MISCEFCKKSQHRVALLFVTPETGAAICDACIDLAAAVVKEHRAAMASEKEV